jgi:ubiquinone/menaquinone biosynthesis C-methylase UbiE
MATTQEVFDKIAPGWYNYRHWTIFRPELEEMARRWRGGKLLNAGCGHGPDFLPFRQGFELYGMDISAGMLEMARKYAGKFDFKVKLAQADLGQLPYPDASFDYAIAVATYHHVKGKPARRQALQELARVLRPGGEAFITVWNRWQPAFWFRRPDTLVPWRTRSETLYRYYHLFSYGELEKLAGQAGLEVLKSFPESRYRCPLKLFSRNVCLLVRKRGRPD